MKTGAIVLAAQTASSDRFRLLRPARRSTFRTAVVFACLPFAGAGWANPAESALPSAPLGPDLRAACWLGDFQRVTVLLNEGAPLEETDRLGRTPLLLACRGNPEVVKVLLNHGAKINAASSNGDTPIGIACEDGVLRNAEMLLDRGADFNVHNQWGRTPLMLAAREGHDALVWLLIKHHTDVNFSQSNDPALVYAVLSDHLSVVRILLAAGAICDRPEARRATPENNAGTLMTTATFNDDRTMIDLLLEHGAQINERNALGISALLQTCMDRNPSLIEYLLGKGADPNLGDNGGQTPLMAAAENQPTDAIDELLQHGAKIDARDGQGRTALTWASIIVAKAQIDELLRQKADVNIEDEKGETALTYAGNRGAIEVVDELKDFGATRTDLHVIAREQANPPLSKPQLWALAVGALYAQWNGFSHDAIYEPEKKGFDQRMLVRDWNITDRAGLLERIHELESPSAWRQILREQLSDLLSTEGIWQKLARILELLYLDLKWGKMVDVGWNESRAANLIRMGMNGGFLNDNEGWTLLFENARQTQVAFGSWRELCQSMLDEREIGSGQIDPHLANCARLLLNPEDPNSPWNKLDWKTDLSSPPP